MALTKRYIRLKEWGVLLDEYRTPSPEYVEGSDGTLPVKDYSLRTDVCGLLEPVVRCQAGRDVKNEYVALGGSFAEALFCEEDYRYWAWFNNQMARLGSDLSLNSAGYSGSTMLHVVVLLLAKAPIFRRASGVLLFPPLSDLSALRFQGGYWTDNSVYSPIVDGEKQKSKPTDDLDLASTRRLLELIRRVCATLDVNLVVHEPVFRRDYTGLDEFFKRFDSGHFERSLEIKSKYIESIESACSEFGIPYVWSDRFRETNFEYFYDELHLNAKGNRVFGELLATKFQALDLCSDGNFDHENFV